MCIGCSINKEILIINGNDIKNIFFCLNMLNREYTVVVANWMLPQKYTNQFLINQRLHKIMCNILFMRFNGMYPI